MADDENKVERADRRDARDTERPHRLFGEALVSARINAHLRRPELAEKAGISYPMLANIESGRRRASDEIIDKLAPVLGLPAERIREVRDALEAQDALKTIETWFEADVRAPVDISWCSAVDLALPGSSDTAPNEPAQASLAEFLLSNLLVDAQRAETLALAASPKQDDTASPRMRMAADIIRDLGSLDDTDLTRVRGYVDGLREARDRAATAVSPTTATPLIRVPSEPFGPLYQWPVPEWIKVTPDLISPRVDLQRYVRDFRREAKTSIWRGSTFHDPIQQLQRVLAEFGVIDDGSWPDADEIRVAAYIGQRVAVRIATGQRGMVEPGVWLQIAGLHVSPKANGRRAVTLDWVFRMALVAQLLWWENTDLQHDFVDLCIDEYARQLLLIED